VTAEESLADIALAQLGQRFAALRIVNPSAEASVLQSMQKYGQLSPVVANRGEGPGSYELLDGFKRFRAAQKLGFEHLKTRVFAFGVRASKAAILELNWAGKSVNHLEEALVLVSLVREDGLTQEQAAVLVGRHKSWVSRRIALVERLCEEVQESLRLGLLSGSLARELARLPRGNQESALACVHKHRLTWRETSRLISRLLEHPRSHHDCLLQSPWEFLGERRPEPPKAEPAARKLTTRLVRLHGVLREILQTLACQDWSAVPAEELAELSRLAVEALDGAHRVIEALGRALDPTLAEPPW
jgi:ParB/RepB/Spo0J family partition protein